MQHEQIASRGEPKTIKETPSNDLPLGFTDFDGLRAAVPLSERTLRSEIKKGRLPAIRMPGGRRLLFHLPSIEKSLLRFQRGGIE
jgi:hypothetical protein